MLTHQVSSIACKINPFPGLPNQTIPEGCDVLSYSIGDHQTLQPQYLTTISMPLRRYLTAQLMQRHHRARHRRSISLAYYDANT